MYRRNALSSYTKQFSEFISLRRRPFSRSIGEYHESHGIARYEENSIKFDEFDSMNFEGKIFLLLSPVVQIYGLP